MVNGRGIARGEASLGPAGTSNIYRRPICWSFCSQCVPVPRRPTRLKSVVAVSGWPWFQVGELRSHPRDQRLIRLSAVRRWLA